MPQASGCAVFITKKIAYNIKAYEWNTTKTKNTVEAYRAYLEKWPQGQNGIEASVSFLLI
jgi:hypothetical protein